jgi:hypothetical protein
LSGIPLELEFYFWERVLSFISYSPESAFFLLEKTKLAHPASHPSFVHGMDIVFFNDIFGLLTSIRRAKMKNQFCDVAKIGDFCNFLAFPQIKDWFLHWIFKIEIVFSLKHHHSISNKGNTIQKFAYILSKINENFLSSFLYR